MLEIFISVVEGWQWEMVVEPAFGKMLGVVTLL
jgi:hypothetical protein